MARCRLATVFVALVAATMLVGVRACERVSLSLAIGVAAGGNFDDTVDSGQAAAAGGRSRVALEAHQWLAEPREFTLYSAEPLYNHRPVYISTEEFRLHEPRQPVPPTDEAQLNSEEKEAVRAAEEVEREGHDAVTYVSGRLFLYMISGEERQDVAADEGATHKPHEPHWVVSRKLGSSHEHDHLARVRSWALTPVDIAHVSPRSKWSLRRVGEKHWDVVGDVSTVCNGPDLTVHLSSQDALFQPLEGVYFGTGLMLGGRRAYKYGRGESARWLYFDNSDHRWVIGDLGTKNQRRLAHLDSQELAPQLLDKDLMLESERHWHVYRWDVHEKQLADGDGDGDGDGGEVHAKKKVPATVLPHGVTVLTATRTRSVHHRLRHERRKITGHDRMLHNGFAVPLVGFGTGGLTEFVEPVGEAFRVGYRLVDLATAYQNEAVVGKTIRESDVVARDDVFITSKLWFSELGFELGVQSVERSMERLGTNYVDQFMLHWPGCKEEIAWMDCKTASGGTWRETWMALERLYAEGVLMSIGVSNFDRALLDELHLYGTVGPHVVQNWFDAAHTDDEALGYCREHGFVFQAYAAMQGFNTNPTYEPYERLRKVATPIAERLGCTVNQVVLRWFVQAGVAVIPRSSSAAHIAENFDLFSFDLERADLDALTAAIYTGKSDDRRPQMLSNDELNDVSSDVDLERRLGELQQLGYKPSDWIHASGAEHLVSKHDGSGHRQSLKPRYVFLLCVIIAALVAAVAARARVAAAAAAAATPTHTSRAPVPLRRRV